MNIKIKKKRKKKKKKKKCLSKNWKKKYYSPIWQKGYTINHKHIFFFICIIFQIFFKRKWVMLNLEFVTICLYMPQDLIYR